MKKLLLLLLCVPLLTLAQQTGCVSGDCENGYGTYIWDNGDKYIGGWSNSLKSGQGKYFWVDGSKYEGGFLDNQIWGKGSFSLENGNMLIGDWEQSNPQNWVTIYCDGHKFDVNFSNVANWLIYEDKSFEKLYLSFSLNTKGYIEKRRKEIKEGEKPFITVSQMPLLGDCKDESCTATEIMKYIARNFKYPHIAKENSVEGRVIVEFVLEKDGKVGRVKILRGIELNRYNEKEDIVILINGTVISESKLKVWINNQNNGFNNGVKALHNECIRVIEELPLFLPGEQHGEVVPVKYTVPIKCTLG